MADRDVASGDAKLRLSRGWSDDMSPEAIQRRLNKVAQLYRAWKLLRCAKPLDDKPAS